MSLGGRIKDFWREQHLFEQRIVLAIVVIATLSMVLLLRLGWLQIVKHDYYTELAEGNQVRIEALPAPRGVIYDRNGVILAENQPAYQLELVPEQVPDLDSTLRRLAEIGLLAEEDLDDVRRTIRSRRGFDSVPSRLRSSVCIDSNSRASTSARDSRVTTRSVRSPSMPLAMSARSPTPI
jgi:penicillin-binding protein 2